MLRNRRQCCCMNNSCATDSYELQNDVMETQCADVMTFNEYEDKCNCGFDEEQNMFPENPMLGQSYVPWQFMDRTFKPCVGLKMGTIFPELVSPYMPGQSMQEIEFIRCKNEIGEGCNKR